MEEEKKTNDENNKSEHKKEKKSSDKNDKDDPIKEGEIVIYNATEERTRKKKKEFLEVFKNSLGIITYSCQKVGISRETFYRWKREDEEFKKEVEESLKIQKNDVEDRLLKAIVADNITAIIFYLKSKHPEYRPALKLSGELDLNDYDKLTDKQLSERIRKYTAKLGKESG